MSRPNQAPIHVRIFLSSPGDVVQERQIATRVIEHLPDDPLFRGRVTTQLVAWDKRSSGAPMLATISPQEAINRKLPLPE